MAGIQNIRPKNDLYDPFAAADRGRARRVQEAGADFVETLARGGTALVGQMLPAIAGTALGAGPLGVGGVGGALGGGLGSGSGADPMQLLMLQEQMQQRAQAFQTASNISKTEHDSKMNAVRNLRAG